MSEEIKIRNYIEGDELRIAPLLHSNFPNAPESQSILETWLWQFKNDFSKESGVAVAERESEIVAHYAVMWFLMNYQDQLIEGAISTATVTDKRVRGKGLFTELARKVYADIKAEGCKIVYGFPNSQSINGFMNRLGWFEIASFPLHLRFINVVPFLKKAIGDNLMAKVLGWLGNLFLMMVFRDTKLGKANPDMEIILCKSIPDGLNDIWEKSFLAQRICLVRDKKYLEWRYLRKPFFKYAVYAAFSKENKVLGYAITNVADKFGIRIIYVMEFAAIEDSKEIYKSLIKTLHKMAERIKADAISLLILPNNPNYAFLLKYGFLPIPKRIFPQDIYFGACIISDDVEKDYVQDSRNWYISWGDLDVV